jgi:sugar phosphate isomerase/epimerase
MLTRRSFLHQSALTAASLLTMPGFAGERPSKYKMGLQLFSIRAPLKNDLAGTIKKVQAIGYEDTETYGFNAEEISYYGMKARDFRKLMDDHNLITTSGHYDFFPFLNKSDDDLKEYVDRCIEGAKALNQKFITWPWIDPPSRTMEKYRVLTGKLNLAGEQIRKAGLGFAYHNHDYEFFDHNGENAYDLIMRQTDASLVKLQIDLYWTMRDSKKSPSQLFSEQPGRFVMWHIKDMDKVTRDYTELGNGSIDYTVILPEAKRAGLQYYYLEQGGNFAKDPMQSVADSAAYFKKNLEHLLKG